MKMTDVNGMFATAQSIADNFKTSVPEGIFLVYESADNRQHSNEMNFYFKSEVHPTYQETLCKIKVAVSYCGAESSDAIGFFDTHPVVISCNYNSRNITELSVTKKIVNAFNKSFELMGLFKSVLPEEIVVRGETHDEREEHLKIGQAKAYCMRIVSSNSKHMRIEGGKVLPAPPSDIRLGDYNIYYNEKTFKVSLSDSSTTLVRID
jgi:hypothetical protein